MERTSNLRLEIPGKTERGQGDRRQGGLLSLVNSYDGKRQGRKMEQLGTEHGEVMAECSIIRLGWTSTMEKTESDKGPGNVVPSNLEREQDTRHTTGARWQGSGKWRSNRGCGLGWLGLFHIPGHLGDEEEGYQPQRSFHMFHLTMAKSEREGLSLAGWR